ncbi:MAG: ribonuclease P protein component [Acidimicrobiales bacterium]
MVGRTGRIATRAGFVALRRQGRRARRGLVTVVRAPGDAASPAADRPCLAFAVSAGAGGAVVRNRIRRRLRALFAALDPDPGWYLVSAGSAAAVAPPDELRTDLAAALRAVGGLRAP